MNLSMYEASVPVFVRGLTNLRAILRKGYDHAQTRQIDPAVLLTSRLFPNMYPLTRQVQTASDAAKFGAARLAAIEPPKFDDVETTFDELDERLEKTITFVQSIDASAFAGSEERVVTLARPSGTLEFTGLRYLLHFAVPNFFFHVTTAYDILRHNGVELVKFDYLGRPDQ